MISDKLDGVDAHVLVFEPAASRQAGRAATEQPTEDERKGAEQIGYKLVERETLPALEAPGPLYVLGNSEALSHKWIGLHPSRNPGDPELQALRVIAAELARIGCQQDRCTDRWRARQRGNRRYLLERGHRGCPAAAVRAAYSQSLGKAGRPRPSRIADPGIDSTCEREVEPATLCADHGHATAERRSDPSVRVRQSDWLGGQGACEVGADADFLCSLTRRRRLPCATHLDVPAHVRSADAARTARPISIFSSAKRAWRRLQGNRWFFCRIGRVCQIV